MRKCLVPIACACLLACGDSGPDFDLQVRVMPHALAPGDTATIMLRVANLSGRPQIVQTECKPPYFVTNAAGDTVSVPGGILVCYPSEPPGMPMEPNDTLARFYFWAGDGGTIANTRLPAGLYTVHGNMDRFRWPTDTIRILP